MNEAAFDILSNAVTIRSRCLTDKLRVDCCGPTLANLTMAIELPPGPPGKPSRGRISRVKRLALVGLALFILLTTAFVVALIWTNGFEISAEGVTPQAARQSMHHRMGLPDTAKDVAYLSSVWFTAIDCSISEAEFIGWCDERGWLCHPLEPGGFRMARWVIRDRRRFLVPFDSGLGFSARDGDFGFGGCFDRDAQRASVTFSTR